MKSANPEWRARFLSARYSPYEARIAADFADADDAERVVARVPHAPKKCARVRSPTNWRTTTAIARPRSTRGRTQLRAKLTSQQLRLETRMQRQDVDDEGTVELRRAIEETRAQIDAQPRRRRRRQRDRRCPSRWREVQAQLPPDTAVLAYFVGDASLARAGC